jgi:hypothetical protein
MNNEVIIHVGIDILFLVASVLLVASVIWIRKFFRGSVSQRGWFVISIGIAFLLAGGLSDLILMIVTEKMTLWMVTIQEVFLSIFLLCLAYGLYSMARAWKNLTEAV